MANDVVHAEIIGEDPDRLREFYFSLFGWSAEPGDSVAPEVSAPGSYAFNPPSADASAVPVGIGGGRDFTSRVIFYVGVDDVEAALGRAVSLGASVVVHPTTRPDGRIRIAQFADPAGNVVGVAGPA